MKGAALVLAALALQGCAAIPVVAAVGVMGAAPGGDADTAPETVANTPEPDAPAPLPVLPRPGALPPQDLPPGACALFLFTRGADPRFAAFAPSDGQTLVLSLDGEMQTLAAAAPFTQAPDAFAQVYKGADGLEARLAATLGDPVPQGRVAPSASLRLAAPDGTAQVTPLSGLLACEDAA